MFLIHEEKDVPNTVVVSYAVQKHLACIAELLQLPFLVWCVSFVSVIVYGGIFLNRTEITVIGFLFIYRVHCTI